MESSFLESVEAWTTCTGARNNFDAYRISDCSHAEMDIMVRRHSYHPYRLQAVDITSSQHLRDEDMACSFVWTPFKIPCKR